MSPGKFVYMEERTESVSFSWTKLKTLTKVTLNAKTDEWHHYNSPIQAATVSY